MAASNQATDDLIRHVQALPQGLLDEIKNFTFIIGMEVIKLHPFDHPPSILAVNRATRGELMAAYYTVLVVARNKAYLIKLLKSVSRKRMQRIRDIKYDIGRGSTQPESAKASYLLATLRRTAILARLRSANQMEEFYVARQQ